MDQNPFALPFKTLPDDLPVFPLADVLLLPFGQLPLNIFEPRYLDMVNDALRGNRLIGMIQPRMEDGYALHDVGCAGKITEFTETPDGRYLISLTGICRFRIKKEIGTKTPYRRVRPDWSHFRDDLKHRACLNVDREKLQSLLSAWFEREDMECNFDKFRDVPDGKLITCLSMICPFEPGEKQALLEQICCVERARLFMKMLEIAVGSRKNCH